jgi:hypothetical protein
MTDKERAIVRQLYALQLELFDHQGKEMDALRQAVDSLQHSHEIIAKMLTLTGELFDDEDQ